MIPLSQGAGGDLLDPRDGIGVGGVSGSTCISTNHVEEIKELEAQVLSLKKDLEKRHEGKSALDKMLSVQQSPNDKSGLGFNSNNKNKSKSKSNKKKGQDKVKDPAKLVCFKCKIEGHHVRSCPLKKKKHLSEKQQGKRPQGQGQAHARPQVEDRPPLKKNQDIVPQEKKSIKKRKGNTCYLCQILVTKYSRNRTKSTPGFLFSPEASRTHGKDRGGGPPDHRPAWRALAAPPYGVVALDPLRRLFAYIKPPDRKPIRSTKTETFRAAAIARPRSGGQSVSTLPERGSAPEGSSIDTAAISTAIFITAAAPMRRE
ncbi:hypothetical protein QYE76_050264 [Lolium multiflorum]|uniref:CCHC-type domain-containing protein n=1 Tax=Lolium multiflorum TaxID=4521 RepID=A0AAD8SQI6_LOLMU|nr:hypothetical protein QYE76_050264 [Lolium multiflorum]